MYKFLLLMLLWLVPLGSAFGADDKFVVPKQTVTGAEEVIPLGDIVVLKPSVITDKPKYLEAVDYEWTVLDSGKEKARVNQGLEDSIYFGSGIQKKKLMAIMHVTYVYCIHENDDPKGKIVQVATRHAKICVDINIGDANPPTPPDPNPTPNPNPPPDLKDDLAKAAYGWAGSKVTDAGDRTKGAAALSKSFSGLASKIAAGGFSTVEDMLAQAHTANNSALSAAGVDATHWHDWSLALKDYLSQQLNAKKLNTLYDFATVFKSISDGLAAVK